MKTLLLLSALSAVSGCGALINRTHLPTITMNTSLTQDQVDVLGAQYWQQGDTRAQCDAALLTNGATQDQVNQFHLGFDLHHTWPGGGPPAHHYIIPGPARVGLPHFTFE